MARAPKVEAPEEAEQDLTAYIGVDPVYMNYSDDRNKPFKAEPEEDEDGNDNLKVVEAEETAYANQAAIRENSGQDPDTGEALETDPDAEYEYKRGSYTHEAQWSPQPRTTRVSVSLRCPTPTLAQMKATRATGAALEVLPRQHRR